MTTISHIFKTKQGTTVDFSKKATAAHLTQISSNGQGKQRYFVALTGNHSTYTEDMQEYTEFEAIDWDGSKISISELDILQY